MQVIIEDEIISIECIGEQELIDIEVGGDNLFFANDILTHNSGYDKSIRKSLTMVTESIKKVENADCIFLCTFIADEEQENSYEVNKNEKIIFQDDKGTFALDIAKHRNGVKNKVVYLRAEFAKYQITDTGVEASGIQKFLENQQIAKDIIEDGIL